MPKLKEGVYVNVYSGQSWTPLPSSVVLSELLCRRGLGVYLQRFSGKKDQGTNYETAAIGHSLLEKHH